MRSDLSVDRVSISFLFFFFLFFGNVFLDFISEHPAWFYFLSSALSFNYWTVSSQLGRVAQSVGHLTRKSGVLGSIPGLATYFRFSFRFFKKGSCQLLAKVCARSTG